MNNPLFDGSLFNDRGALTYKAGGTGQHTVSPGDVLYGAASGPNPWARLAAPGKAVPLWHTGVVPTYSPATQGPTSLSSGNNNNFALNDDAVFLRLTGHASGSVLTGIAGGISGRHLWVQAVTTGFALANATTSTAGNRFGFFASGTGQTISLPPDQWLHLYYGSGNTWEIVGSTQLGWQDVPYSAGNFSAQAGTWTVASGDVSLNRYLLRWPYMLWQFTLTTTSTSATPAHLYITVPGGFSVQNQNQRGYSCGWVDTGPGAGGPCGWFLSGASQLALQQTYLITLWPTATNTLEVFGEIILELA